MTIKSILVPFFEKEAARTAFKSAAAVAREMNAHVCAAYMRQRPMPTSVVYYPLGGAFPPENDDVYKRAEDDNAAALRELFDELSEAERLAAAPIGKRTDEMGATAEWRDLKGDLPDGFARLAAAFDLVSMARPGGEDEAFHENLLESLLFRSRRPLLVSPPGGFSRAPERVVVAWNASPEAAAAAAAGRAFMAEAKMVKILSVHEPDADKVSPDLLAASLGLHGVETSETSVELEKGENVVDVLAREVADAAADLVIMGAYTHHRWRQTFFGGFTRLMLEKAEIPVLLAR